MDVPLGSVVDWPGVVTSVNCEAVPDCPGLPRFSGLPMRCNRNCEDVPKFPEVLGRSSQDVTLSLIPMADSESLSEKPLDACFQ
jgi:hypothetical protein